MYFLVVLLSGLLTYFTQKIFIYYKRFDDFNHRSSHKTLATSTGGINVAKTPIPPVRVAKVLWELRSLKSSNLL